MTETHSKHLERVLSSNTYFVFSWLIHYFSGVGGWVGEIKDKVHLSPAEAEIRAELGNKSISPRGGSRNFLWGWHT